MALPISWRHHGHRTTDDRFGRYGHCAQCGGELLRVILAPRRSFPDDGPFAHHIYSLTPLCGQCATPEELAYASHSMSCPGCSISMQISPRDAMMTKWPACSDRCYQRAWRQSRRMKQRACEVCRATFSTARTDTRFCSGACRQWAFRLRRRATGPSERVKLLTFEPAEVTRAEEASGRSAAHEPQGEPWSNAYRPPRATRA
jgi:hypothetical protein